jgi:hypothetical protein
VDVLALLDAVEAAGLSEAMQDAVALTVGNAVELPLTRVKGLLVAAGVGAAAALRISTRLVRPVLARFLCTSALLVL